MPRKVFRGGELTNEVKREMVNNLRDVADILERTLQPPAPPPVADASGSGSGSRLEQAAQAAPPAANADASRQPQGLNGGKLKSKKGKGRQWKGGSDVNFGNVNYADVSGLSVTADPATQALGGDHAFSQLVQSSVPPSAGGSTTNALYDMNSDARASLDPPLTGGKRKSPKAKGRK